MTDFYISMMIVPLHHRGEKCNRNSNTGSFVESTKTRQHIYLKNEVKLFTLKLPLLLFGNTAVNLCFLSVLLHECGRRMYLPSVALRPREIAASFSL